MQMQAKLHDMSDPVDDPLERFILDLDMVEIIEPEE